MDNDVGIKTEITSRDNGTVILRIKEAIHFKRERPQASEKDTARKTTLVRNAASWQNFYSELHLF